MKNNFQKRRLKVDLTGTGYCAAFNTRKTARAITALYDSMLQPFGIRSTQFGILVAIAKTGSIAMGRLANVLLIDATTLTRSLRLMERDGLLSVSGRVERRQRFVNLLPAGEKQLIRSVPRWREMHLQLIKKIGPNRWIRLRDELEELSLIAIALDQSSQGSRSLRGRPKAKIRTGRRFNKLQKS